jgi:hypothetical protein
LENKTALTLVALRFAMKSVPYNSCTVHFITFAYIFSQGRGNTASTTSEYLNFMRETEASYLETLEAQRQ